jgi:trans-aconitate methyltransferase
VSSDRRGFDPEFFEPLAGVEERSFWFQARNRLIVSTIRRRFPEAASFLEIGSGSGVVLAALHEQFPSLRLVGGELYEEGLAIARRRVPDAELLALDARALEYENEFDLVGAFDVLEHIDEDEQVLAHMVRAARPGGGILVLVPQHQWLWSKHDEFVEHRRRYARKDLVAKAERAGAEVLETTSFVTSLLPAMAASRFVDRLRKRTDPIANLEPGPLNALFERMLDGERKLIERGVSLPVGGSLMLIGRKPRLP